MKLVVNNANPIEAPEPEEFIEMRMPLVEAEEMLIGAMWKKTTWLDKYAHAKIKYVEDGEIIVMIFYNKP